MGRVVNSIPCQAGTGVRGLRLAVAGMSRAAASVHKQHGYNSSQKSVSGYYDYNAQATTWVAAGGPLLMALRPSLSPPGPSLPHRQVLLRQPVLLLGGALVQPLPAGRVGAHSTLRHLNGCAQAGPPGSRAGNSELGT